jgi:NAD(P)-dependent dehydrogenase (short-subunit alcohol dehydrogenase family)
LLTKYALSLLTDAGPGRVVNLSSGMGQLSRMSGGSPTYRVSKVAINGLSAYLDAEYDGLIANAVSPGWVATDMGGSEAPRTPEKGAETPLWLARFRNGPGGRLWKDKAIVEW